jgi:hypothetical protein
MYHIATSRGALQYHNSREAVILSLWNAIITG